jgi:hypothetical protein
VSSTPMDNIDMFLRRPVDAVAALLPDEQRAHAAVAELGEGGIDVAGVLLLHGAEGVRIFDRSGEGHGKRSRILRLLQGWGYDAGVMDLYDEGLRKGQSLIVVPSSYGNRIGIGEVFEEHGGHAVSYFGSGRMESLTGP